jgi:hypothetical protein
MSIVINARHSLGAPFYWLLHQVAAIRAPRVTIIPAPGHTHRIQKGATVSVQRPNGLEVVCLQGTLWITHDGDVKDIVLERGQRYAADRNARMLVHALDAAELRLLQAQGWAAPARVAASGKHARQAP